MFSALSWSCRNVGSHLDIKFLYCVVNANFSTHLIQASAITESPSYAILKLKSSKNNMNLTLKIVTINRSQCSGLPVEVVRWQPSGNIIYIILKYTSSNKLNYLCVFFYLLHHLMLEAQYLQFKIYVFHKNSKICICIWIISIIGTITIVYSFSEYHELLFSNVPCIYVISLFLWLQIIWYMYNKYELLSYMFIWYP